MNWSMLNATRLVSAEASCPFSISNIHRRVFDLPSPAIVPGTSVFLRRRLPSPFWRSCRYFRKPGNEIITGLEPLQPQWSPFSGGSTNGCFLSALVSFLHYGVPHSVRVDDGPTLLCRSTGNVSFRPPWPEAVMAGLCHWWLDVRFR